jgi:hypothetical protein
MSAIIFLHYLRVLGEMCGWKRIFLVGEAWVLADRVGFGLGILWISSSSSNTHDSSFNAKACCEVSPKEGTVFFWPEEEEVDMR